MQGLVWQPLQLPLAAGVDQRTDDRALQPPELAVALDVQFDEIGGLQTRKPFASLGSSIAGGGSISTARRHYANGNEHVLFTQDSLYSWNDQLDRWVFRATHLAVSVEETTVFTSPGDQYDCDRAELTGIVFTAWTDADKVYVAVADKASGATLLAPTAVGGTGTRPRLLALTTKVLLFWNAGTDASPGNFLAMAFDPAVTDPATWSTQITTPSSTTVLAAASFGAYYDVAKIPLVDTAAFACRRATTTSYTIGTCTAGMVVATSTKARTCDGPIAISCSPDGVSLQIIRANNTNIQGDRIAVSGLADAATAQAVGTVSSTPVSQIAAAHRSVQNSGAYRCCVFWTSEEAAGTTGWLTKTNYVDTGGAIGTQSTFNYVLGIASRAFDYNGSVFVWCVFAQTSSMSGAGMPAFRAQLQNTYFLYRDDATLQAKAAGQRAGGLSPSVGRLPGVALTSGSTVFSWCGTERRIVPVGTSGLQTSYSDRGPRHITFTFDSNKARRCVRLGETLYVSGAEILQYDGVGLYEVGFHVYPWYFDVQLTGAGNLPDGTYAYKATWRWENAKGERDRSTTASVVSLTVSAGPKKTSMSAAPLTTTRKTTAKPVAVEAWRTVIAPPEDAPFYLITSQDPTNATNPNRYIPNVMSGLATLDDSFADSTLTTKETNPENGDVLENLAPPGAQIIAATDTRIFLAGVAGDPDRVWYSKIRGAGEVVAFHDALTFDVPKDGGSITGIGFLNGICVVFREMATYMFPGDGFDNTGRGANYGPPQLVSFDVGCRDTDSIVTTPEGIAFQSSKGKYLLTRGWTMQPIGLPVSDYNSEIIVAAHVVAAQHQVRWLTASRMLVFDYLVNQWAEWTVANGVHAAIWQGTYHYLLAAGPLAELTTFSGATYGLDVETAWIKPGDLQGAVEIRRPQVLGEWRSTHHLRFRVAYDYKTDWVDESYWFAVPGSTGLPLQHRIPTSRQKMQAIKIRITAVGTATQATMDTIDDVPLLPSGFWAATLEAEPLGTLGNDLTLSIGVSVVAGATAFIDVRDNQIWNQATEAWSVLAKNVGIRCITPTGTVLITDVEAAINADSNLLESSVNLGTDTLDVASFGGATITLSPQTAGGAFAAPTGESLKLTGLGLEVGLTPRLHARFPRIGGVNV